MQRKPITLEQKLRYLKEVESIHALGKKVRPPAGKSWSDIADSRMRHIMGLPIAEPAGPPLRLRRGKLHHEHSPRSARLIERTLQNGVIDPAVLRGYHTGERLQTGKFSFQHAARPTVEPLRHDDRRVVHMVQHGAVDLKYPHGHMQGQGFIPREHEFNSHVELKGGPVAMGTQVPSKEGAAAGAHYH